MIQLLPENCNPLNSEIIRQLFQFAKTSGTELHVVGGYLRDACVANESFNADTAKDIDLAVYKEKAFEFAKRFATVSGGHFVPLDEKNDCARVVISESGKIFDFAGRVGATVEADLGRRDFTINALAWSPDNPAQIIDLFGGIDDLRAKQVKAVSEKTFADDPLRVLRALRFAAALDFDIEKQTSEYVVKYASLLSSVAAERINVELFTALNFNCGKLIHLFGESGVLEVIFPELIETRRVTPNDYHHLGLFEHSFDTVPQLETRLNSLEDWVSESLVSEISYGVTKLAATKLSCILHDIGKPQTWQINEDGRHTFYAHDVIGAQMCEVVAERLRWSKPVTRLIVKLVKWHLRPGALFLNGPSTARAMNRFYRQVGDDMPELILLALADFGATRGPGLAGERRNTQERALFALLDGFKVFRDAQKVRVRLLDGKDIMRLLDIPAGPLVGKILAELEEAQEFKEVSNRLEAELFVKKLHQEKLSK